MGDAGGYSKGVNIMTLMETKWGHSEHRNDLAALAGATRMVTAAETEDGHHWDEATIKDLTGGMTSITCREIHGKPFSFVPQFKLWVMSNYAPVIKGADWAIWRRVKRIPWNHDFNLHPEEKDPDFSEKLKAEAPGILNWMLGGLGSSLRTARAFLSARQSRMPLSNTGRTWTSSEGLPESPWTSGPQPRRTARESIPHMWHGARGMARLRVPPAASLPILGSAIPS